MSTCWPGLHAGRWMTRDSLEEQLGRFRKLPVAWLRGSPRALFPRPRTAPLPLSWSRLPSAPGHAGSWCAGDGTRGRVAGAGAPGATFHEAAQLSSPRATRRPRGPRADSAQRGDVFVGAAPCPPSTLDHSAWSPPQQSDRRMSSGDFAVLACLLMKVFDRLKHHPGFGVIFGSTSKSRSSLCCDLSPKVQSRSWNAG